MNIRLQLDPTQLQVHHPTEEQTVSWVEDFFIKVAFVMVFYNLLNILVKKNFRFWWGGGGSDSFDPEERGRKKDPWGLRGHQVGMNYQKKTSLERKVLLLQSFWWNRSATELFENTFFLSNSLNFTLEVFFFFLNPRNKLSVPWKMVTQTPLFFKAQVTESSMVQHLHTVTRGRHREFWYSSVTREESVKARRVRSTPASTAS